MFAAALAFAAPAQASDHPANVQWESYLPGLPSRVDVQPGPLPGCRRPSIRCVTGVVRKLRNLQSDMRCDHRGVFATTYLELTRELRDTAMRDPRFFTDMRYFFRQDALFANVYLRAVRDWRRDRPVAPAWRIAFETAARGDANAAQDMLLGINAHVQNDMPFVLAALGLRTPGGASRKPDHDKGNLVLDSGYERVVRAVAGRYDPFVATTNADWNPADDVLGLEMVKGWREGVWRNAERLLDADNEGERREVARQIEEHAAMWARSIATPQGPPGYRSQRDAYCASKLG